MQSQLLFFSQLPDDLYLEAKDDQRRAYYEDECLYFLPSIVITELLQVSLKNV